MWAAGCCSAAAPDSHPSSPTLQATFAAPAGAASTIVGRRLLQRGDRVGDGISITGKEQIGIKKKDDCSCDDPCDKDCDDDDCKCEDDDNNSGGGVSGA